MKCEIEIFPILIFGASDPACVIAADVLILRFTFLNIPMIFLKLSPPFTHIPTAGVREISAQPKFKH